MRSSRSPGRLELAILVVGLAGAVLSGAAAYRLVGPYGDGPFGAGFRRIPDPATGGSLLAHDMRVGGTTVRAIVDESTGRMSDLRLPGAGARAWLDDRGGVRLAHDSNADGVIDRLEYYADLRQFELQRVEKVGYSLAGDRIVDAWAFHDPRGQVTRVEVSTARDGVIDRWEHYEAGVLVRVEADTDGDGRVDSWSSYVNGILSATASDEDGDGRIDRGAVPGGGGP